MDAVVHGCGDRPYISRRCLPHDAQFGEWFPSNLGGREREAEEEDWCVPPLVRWGSPHTSLEDAIRDSADLLHVAGHSDEAAPAIDPNARIRAIAFLRTHADEACRRGYTLAVPRILPGPDGSVDVHWELDDFEVLLNFPVDAGAPATFYGDDRRQGGAIKGTIAARDRRSLLPWLIW